MNPMPDRAIFHASVIDKGCVDVCYRQRAMNVRCVFCVVCCVCYARRVLFQCTHIFLVAFAHPRVSGNISHICVLVFVLCVVCVSGAAIDL